MSYVFLSGSNGHARWVKYQKEMYPGEQLVEFKSFFRRSLGEPNKGFHSYDCACLVAMHPGTGHRSRSVNMSTNARVSMFQVYGLANTLKFFLLSEVNLRRFPDGIIGKLWTMAQGPFEAIFESQGLALHWLRARNESTGVCSCCHEDAQNSFTRWRGHDTINIAPLAYSVLQLYCKRFVVFFLHEDNLYHWHNTKLKIVFITPAKLHIELVGQGWIQIYLLGGYKMLLHHTAHSMNTGVARGPGVGSTRISRGGEHPDILLIFRRFHKFHIGTPP